VIDLHLHSSLSDGTLAVGSLVNELVTNKISHAALTDHDTVAGIEEFLSRTKVNGIQAVAGVEITAESDKDSTYHTLGYRIDISNNFLLGTSGFLSCSRTATLENTT